ncbi:MAG: hypothetical protein AAGA85_02685 [Bacteroidota bacterium]
MIKTKKDWCHIIGRIMFPMMLLLGSCGSESKLKALDKGSVREEVTQMLYDYHAAILSGGLMAEFDYLDDSEDFFWVPPGYATALPYDSIRAILEQSARSIVSADLTWDTLWVYPLTPSLATFHGIVSGEMVHREDPVGTTRQVKMIESGTIIRRASRWRLLSGQTTSLVETTAGGSFSIPSPYDTLAIPADSALIPMPLDPGQDNRADSLTEGVRTL